MTGERLRKISRLRMLTLSYVAVLLILLAWSLREYTSVVRKYEDLWTGVPLIHLSDNRFYSPIALLSCGIRGNDLVVHILRTYAQPSEENVTVFVMFQVSNSGAVMVKVHKRVALGETLLLTFPVGTSIEKLIGCRIEIYLERELVLVKESTPC